MSLLILSALAFAFSLLFKMSDVISAILAMRIVVQFIGQAAGVILLRKKKAFTKEPIPWKMPLYPLPVILVILMWALVFMSTGSGIIGSFLLVFGSGIIVYLITAWLQKQWPFPPGNS